MRRIFGKWEKKHVHFLNSLSITIEEGFDSFDIYEDDIKYRLLANEVNDAVKFSNNRIRAIFDNHELEAAESFVLIGGYRLKGHGLSNDISEVVRSVYKDWCETCYHAVGHQVNDFVFKQLPKLKSKVELFSPIGSYGLLFAQKKFYNEYFKRWHIAHRLSYVGKNRKLIENIVQLDIPVSSSPLRFGSSYFKEPYLKETECLPVCRSCDQSIYTNQLLDYFPGFAKPCEFDIVKTQEWFGGQKHVVISKRFASFLTDINIIKYDNYSLVPVKNFL